MFEVYPYDTTDWREADTGDRLNVLRMVRGGSFHDTFDLLRAPSRFGFTPDLESEIVGLRCARSSRQMLETSGYMFSST